MGPGVHVVLSGVQSGGLFVERTTETQVTLGKDPLLLLQWQSTVVA